ncbi:MAG: SDR family oxidoreductase [Spirochaetales bacterium]|nr:SDR family oxidoreductase [Spirochaetales bacterium]
MKDMSGKVCMVTGANSGIGRETALQLARMRANVVMVCRDRERGEKAQREIMEASGNKNTDLLIADLSSLEQIKRLVKEFKSGYEALHVLINNAGTILFKRQENAEGIEATFAINHLGPFRLTNLLLDTIKKSAPSRIINVSSAAHRFTDGNFAAVREKNHYSGFRMYGLSKLANVLFTKTLARKLEGTGVIVNAVHPGFVRSNFGNSNLRGPFTTGLFKIIGSLFAITPEKGAATSVYLATADEVAPVTGEYFFKKKPACPSDTAFDEKLGDALWDMSLKYGL